MQRLTFGQVLNWALQMMIRCYQLAISPLLPPSCRFLPSCSDYAVEAIGRHGALVGLGLALRRLARCQDRKSTRLNSSHSGESRMPSSA